MKFEPGSQEWKEFSLTLTSIAKCAESLRRSMARLNPEDTKAALKRVKRLNKQVHLALLPFYETKEDYTL